MEVNKKKEKVSVMEGMTSDISISNSSVICSLMTGSAKVLEEDVDKDGTVQK